ncbi:MAG: hypothetical protein CVV32_03980 [Methanomicrobiales archaeon HGW-Methanomicrobiales-3]|jgi:hypothetical protein|nr:MAG: hypothetical protein CVV32_03980 [Methanomicrobiales archaeon HGW-Methanomicrobiales-3]
MTHHHEAFEKHNPAGGTPCRVCSGAAPEGREHGPVGVCTSCWYKILILILIVMIASSYVVWFGLL